MDQSHRSSTTAKNFSLRANPSRRNFLFGAATSLFAATRPHLVAATFAPDRNDSPLKIEAVELVELHGRYTDEAGVNRQQQVNPLDIYDDLRPAPYADKPSGTREVQLHRNLSSHSHCWRPRGALRSYRKERSDRRQRRASPVPDRQRRARRRKALGPDVPFQSPLARWFLHDGDQCRRQHPVGHSRQVLQCPRLSSPRRAHASLSRDVRKLPRLLTRTGSRSHPRARQSKAKAIAIRSGSWATAPVQVPKACAKNVELVRVLRETLGDDTELMFDAYSGWTQNYVLEWAHQVEQYQPYWIEEATHPEKIESFAVMHRSTTIPIASGEHFYGRWEVERYLEAGGLSVVQADPEWCGGTSELLRIGTVASLHDVPVIPHGHSLRAAIHIIASQSPMTFPARRIPHQQDAPLLSLREQPARPRKSAHRASCRRGLQRPVRRTKIESQTILKPS